MKPGPAEREANLVSDRARCGSTSSSVAVPSLAVQRSRCALRSQSANDTPALQQIASNVPPSPRSKQYAYCPCAHEVCGDGPPSGAHSVWMPPRGSGSSGAQAATMNAPAISIAVAASAMTTAIFHAVTRALAGRTRSGFCTRISSGPLVVLVGEGVSGNRACRLWRRA